MDSYKNYRDKGKIAYDSGDIQTAKSNLLKAASIIEEMSKDAYSGEHRAKYNAMGQEILEFVRTKCSGTAVPVGVSQEKTTTQYAENTGEYNLTFLLPQDNEMSFEKIIGAEDAKAKIRRFVINPILNPEPYKRKKLKIDLTVLLDGPPGSGKTSFAMAAAKEANLPLVVVEIPELVDKYVGETAKHISALFQELRRYIKEKNTPVILCFDEIDEITKKRGGDDKGSDAALPQLLREIQGIGSNNENLIIIATTNVKDTIDSGVLSRFKQKIEVPLPSEEALNGLFKLMLDGLTSSEMAQLDIVRTAKIAQGLSGRDIRHITEELKFWILESEQNCVQIVSLQDSLDKLVRTKKAENGIVENIEVSEGVVSEMFYFCNDITNALCKKDFESALELANELKGYITSQASSSNEEEFK